MAALTETRMFRLSDCFGAPADDVLGPLPPPKPIPHLTGQNRRVLQEVIDWEPTVCNEISEYSGIFIKDVRRASADIEKLGLITRTRGDNNNEPYILRSTPEGRRVAAALKAMERW